MTRTTIPVFPFSSAFADARLDDIRIETSEKRTDLIIDFREIRLSSETEQAEQDGVLVERVRGDFIPHRVRFVDVTIKYLTGDFTDLPLTPADHPARILLGMLTWRLTGDKHPSYRLFNGSPDTDLWFSAKTCMGEERYTAITPAEFVRTHSPAPALTAGLVPVYPFLNRQFGGDPITIHLSGRSYPRRLFISGLDIQPNQRPDVNAVLNLGEAPSQWVTYPVRTASEADAWVEKGEGSAGMTVSEIKAEAEWVIERLQKHQRVLVHCVAGFNRSVTVCAAVLMLLEGLTPEAALARVREHHAWAKPDPVHWLRLKGLFHSF